MRPFLFATGIENSYPVIALPDGPAGDVIAFTPPFCVSREEIGFAVGKLRGRLAE